MLILRSGKTYAPLVKALVQGEVAVMACDTIYGFVGRVPDTEDVIRRIKGRQETKPFLQLISGKEQLSELAVILPETDILNLWPGPYTFVFSRLEGDTVAYRVPKDSRLRRIVQEVGTPIYSTSVNRAGEIPMDDPAKIEAEFGDEVAFVEDSGVYAGRQGSTIVDVTRRPYRILRAGSAEVPQDYL